MINKIFLLLFAISVLLLSTVTYLTYSQLQSNGFAPLQIISNFQFYDSWNKTLLWITSVVLLLAANLILWKNRSSWALWMSFGFFSVFVLLNMWWLSSAFINYTKDNDLSNGSFNVGGIFAAFFVVVVGIGVYFNQFIVFRLHDKMFQKQENDNHTENIETEKQTTE